MDALDEHDDVEAVHAQLRHPGGAARAGRRLRPSLRGGIRGRGPESVRVTVVMGIDPGVASTGFGVVRVGAAAR